MEREDILEYLEYNLNYFKDIDKETLNLLRKKKLDNIEEYYQVTPLLKQITNFALIVEIIDDLEMDEISEMYDDLSESLEICNMCNDLIYILIEEKFNHPSIMNFKNSKNGLLLRDKIFKMTFSLIDNFILPPELDNDDEYDEKYDDEDDYDSDLIYKKENKKENEKMNYIISLRNDICSLDEPTEALLNFMFKYVLFSGKEKALKEADLLRSLASYSNMKIKLYMLISDTDFNLYQYKDNNLLYNAINDEEFYPTFSFKIADAITSFSEIFVDLEKLLNSDLSYKQINIINKLKEAYHLYQSYRYNYLITNEEENKLLSKRKKY